MKRAFVLASTMLVGCAESPPPASPLPPSPNPAASSASPAASPPASPAVATETPSTAAPPPSTAPASSDPDALVMPPTKKSYSIVVGFGSPGNGTDHEAAKRLETIMKTQKVVVHERGRWGKEGEHDECFDLGAMPASEQAKLFARLRREVASARTTVTMNAPCRNDR